MGVGAALAAVGYLGTEQLQGKAPLWTFGTGYPIGGWGLLCGGVEGGMRFLPAARCLLPAACDPAACEHVDTGWVLGTEDQQATTAAHLSCNPANCCLPTAACLPPAGAALVALYGFAVAAMWIALFASEIVGLLEFFGLLR